MNPLQHPSPISCLAHERGLPKREAGVLAPWDSSSCDCFCAHTKGSPQDSAPHRAALQHDPEA